jgi:hypothetical protein
LRRCAELILHEILIDIERPGAEDLDGTEDSLEERDAFVDIWYRDANMVHAIDFVRHVIVLIAMRVND